MRKRILGLAVLVIIMTQATFATNINDNVSKKVLATFNEKFVEAKEVSWSTTDMYVKASFKLNEQFMFAYFSEMGELLGTTRNILIYQLPINLQSELKKNLTSSWITELYEFTTEDETVYYATIENADQKIMFRSEGMNAWSVFKRITKDF